MEGICPSLPFGHWVCQLQLANPSCTKCVRQDLGGKQDGASKHVAEKHVTLVIQQHGSCQSTCIPGERIGVQGRDVGASLIPPHW